MFERVEQLRAVATAEGLTMVQLAYAWVASRPEVDSILVGPATVAQLDEALDAASACTLRGRARSASTSCRASGLAPTPATCAEGAVVDCPPSSRTTARTAGRGSASSRTKPTLEALRARADDIMMGRVVYEGLFFQHDSGTGRYEDLEFGRGWVGPSLSYRKIEKLERDPVFRAWLENPLLERVVRAVVGDDVAIYRATLFNKSAEGGTELPWHQDGGSFWGLDRDPELQIWTALDDAPVEAGCVEVLDGEPSGRPGHAPRRQHSPRRGRPRVRPTHGGCSPSRARGRGAPHPQPPLAPLGHQHHRPAAPRLHGGLHARVDAVHTQAAREAPVHARVRSFECLMPYRK